MASRLELIGDSAGSLGISQEEGAADITYQIAGATDATAPTSQDLDTFIDTFCGGVENLEPKLVDHRGTANAGKVIRQLPPVHPLRPELSSAGVVSLGPATETHEAANAVSVYGLDSASKQWPNATAWRGRVRFVKRPYFLLPNEKIELKSTTYFPPDNAPSLRIYYAEEWRRFTKTTRVPAPDNVEANNGTTMRMRTASGGEPNDRPIPYGSFMYLQNELIEVEWFLVPYRYMLDFMFEQANYRSYLTRFVNHVNQRDWWNYKAGTLMFLGATPQSFIPASPKRQKFLNALALGLDQSLLMNVKLRFLYTGRQGTDVPAEGHALLSNKNNIAAGHNLLPNFQRRKFYYAATPDPDAPTGGGDDTKKNAAFPSFPFELLFTDPLLKQEEPI